MEPGKKSIKKTETRELIDEIKKLRTILTKSAKNQDLFNGLLFLLTFVLFVTAMFQFISYLQIEYSENQFLLYLILGLFVLMILFAIFSFNRAFFEKPNKKSR